MERPQPPAGGEQEPVNTYGTDNPAEQARIEQARSSAAAQRMRDRQAFDRYVEAGVNAEDATALVEFGHLVDGEQHATGSSGELATRASNDEDAPTGQPAASLPTHDSAVETTKAHAEHARRADPRIYVACLASYNNGILHGLWIDADRDIDELQTDIVATLASSPIPGAEEWAIHDQEGFQGFEVGEYEDLAVVSRVAKGIAEHGEAFAAYLGWAGTDDAALEQFGDHFMGTYDSVEAWVQEVAEDQEWSRKLDDALDLLIRPHVSIDYRSFAEHMESEGWQLVRGREGVHVFAP